MARQAPRRRSGRVASGALSLHYVEWGPEDGFPLVAVHGGSAHALWWEDFAACLPHLRVIAPDLRGHGDSDHAEPADYAIATYARELAALAGAVAGPRFALAGHSLGGLVAMEYAASARGAGLQALILVDTGGRIGRRAARFLQALHRMPHLTHRSLGQAVAAFRLMTDGTNAPPQRIERVARHAFRRDGAAGWALKFDRRALSFVTECDLRDRLERIDCPVLLVRGALSRVVSAADLQAMAARCPHATVAEVPGACHHVMLDHPEALAAAVDRFLERARDGAGGGS